MFKPYLTYKGEFAGYLDEPTDHCDYYGHVLYIGDYVGYFRNEKEKRMEVGVVILVDGKVCISGADDPVYKISKILDVLRVKWSSVDDVEYIREPSKFAEEEELLAETRKFRKRLRDYSSGSGRWIFKTCISELEEIIEDVEGAINEVEQEELFDRDLAYVLGTIDDADC